MTNLGAKVPSNVALQKASKSALKAALKILDSWSCSKKEMSVILNIPESSLEQFKIKPGCVLLEHEQQIRISSILNIYQSIKLLFNNPNNADNFMRLKNFNEPFQGRIPLELLLEGSIDNFALVHNHLDNLVARNWQ